MKNISIMLLTLFICMTSQIAVAQKGKLYLEQNTVYSKSRIYIKRNLDPIYAKELKLVNDTVLQYKDSETGLEKSLNVHNSSVNYIKVKTGTQAGSFALYGGLLGGLSAVVGVLNAEGYSVDEYGDTSGINWLPFVGGFTAGGALIGALIGVWSPKYKNFYLKDNSTAFTLSVEPQYIPGKEAGIGIRITF